MSSLRVSLLLVVIAIAAIGCAAAAAASAAEQQHAGLADQTQRSHARKRLLQNRQRVHERARAHERAHAHDHSHAHAHVHHSALAGAKPTYYYISGGSVSASGYKYPGALKGSKLLNWATEGEGNIPVWNDRELSEKLTALKKCLGGKDPTTRTDEIKDTGLRSSMYGIGKLEKAVGTFDCFGSVSSAWGLASAQWDTLSKCFAAAKCKAVAITDTRAFVSAKPDVATGHPKCAWEDDQVACTPPQSDKDHLRKMVGFPYTACAGFHLIESAIQEKVKITFMAEFFLSDVSDTGSLANVQASCNTCQATLLAKTKGWGGEKKVVGAL